MPIEALIDQVKGAIEYAAAGNTPYTPLQVVGIAYQLIFQNGMLNDYCKMWKQQDPANKTWTQFNKFFATAHKELRESQATTAGAGYHAVNHVNHVYQQETVDTMSNLATATASN